MFKFAKTLLGGGGDSRSVGEVDDGVANSEGRGVDEPANRGDGRGSRGRDGPGGVPQRADTKSSSSDDNTQRRNAGQEHPATPMQETQNAVAKGKSGGASKQVRHG